MKLQIDPEFRDLIPPLTDDEHEELERSLSFHGCYSPIVVWEGLILDGHNRYAICVRDGIDYQTCSFDIRSRSEAILWIIKNQFGRRNLSMPQRMDLALRMEAEIAEQARARIQAGIKPHPEENFPQGENSARGPQTRDQVAALAGVSGRTIDKYKNVRDTAAPELTAAVQAGDVSVHAAAQAAKTLTPEQQAEAATAPEPAKAVREAVKQAAPTPTPHESTLLGIAATLKGLPAPFAVYNSMTPSGITRLDEIEAAQQWLVEFVKLARKQRHAV